MGGTILRQILPYAGLAGLSVLVFYYLFREVIRKNIFPTLTGPRAYSLLRLFLILVWLIAIFGIAAWVYWDLNRKERGEEIGTASLGGGTDLRLVDVAFITSPDGQPNLDLKLRNVSELPIYIKRADVVLLDSAPLRDLAHYEQQEITWVGNIILPSKLHLELSQSVKPRDTDRIQFHFVSSGEEKYVESIYQFTIRLVYNENDATLTTRPIIMLMPRQAKLLGSYTEPEESRSNAKANASTLARFLSKPAVYDPRFERLVQSYRRAGLGS